MKVYRVPTILLVFALASSGQVYAQTISWLRTFGDSARDVGYGIMQDSSGAFFAVGSTTSYVIRPSNIESWLLVQVTHGGDSIYLRGTKEAFKVSANNILPMLDGDSYVSGRITDDTSFRARQEYFGGRLRSDRRIHEIAYYSDTTELNYYPRTSIRLHTGEFLTVGIGLVLRIDTDGLFASWTHRIHGTAAAELYDGRLLVSTSGYPGKPGTLGLQMFSATGDSLWFRPVPGFDSAAIGVSELPDGRILMITSSMDSAAPHRMHPVEVILDSNGAELSHSGFGPAAVSTIPTSFIPLRFGGYAMVGVTYPTADLSFPHLYTATFNASGSLIREGVLDYSTPIYATALTESFSSTGTPDGYAITGTDGPIDSPTSQLIIAKLSTLSDCEIGEEIVRTIDLK